MHRLLCCVTAAPLLAALPAFATTFTVTKTADTYDGACNSDCSLRDAVQAANANPGADTIVLKGSVYKITRATPRDPELDDNVNVDEEQNQTGDFDIAGDLLIRGQPGATAVDGNHLDRVFDVLSGSVEFRDFEIRNGYARERGAGIANAGSMKLTRMRLRLNNASSGFNLGQGGAISNTGTLSIANSQVRDNNAGGGEASSGEGGGIWNSGRLNVRDTAFTGNVTHDDNDIGGGGAIMNHGGLVTIDRSFFQGNATMMHGHGGAIANRDGGTLKLTNSTVSDNTSGEPDAGGGAIANGTRFGGAGPGGDGGRVVLNFVTIVDNDGGGLFNNRTLDAFDSIVAGNYEDFGGGERSYTAGTNCMNVYALRTSGVVMGMDGNCSSADMMDNAAALTELVHPLANNGGFAPTHALRDSPLAIDRATLFLGTCPATDQRGAIRPADGDADGTARCDIGAFERGDDD